MFSLALRFNKQQRILASYYSLVLCICSVFFFRKSCQFQRCAFKMIKLVFICVSLVCASLYFSRAGSTPQNQVRQWSISFIYQKIFFFHYTTYLRRIGSRENILKTIVTVSGKDDKECVNQFISVPQ